MGSFSLKFLIFLQLMNFSSIISLNIFPIPTVPVLCLKNTYLQRWKLWMHFLYLFNFFSILPDFFLHIHRVSLQSQINNSVFIHAKLLFSPSIKFFHFNFQNLSWFSALFQCNYDHCNASLHLKWNTNTFFFFEVFFWIMRSVALLIHLNPVASWFSTVWLSLFILANEWWL